MYWPIPSKQPGVSATGLNGKPITPYILPIKTFVGRILDSSQTREWQTPLRTLRARAAKVHGNRITSICGSALVSYDLQDLIRRLATNEPLVSATNYGATNRGTSPELVLGANGFWNAERAPGWTLDHVDGSDRLYGFDTDDRGFTYVATNPYGWGIIGFNFEHVYQHYPSDITPNEIICVRVGGRYLVVVSWQAGLSAVFDVTNPGAPERMANIASTLGHYAKSPNRDICVVFGGLKLYTPLGLASGIPTAVFAADSGGYQSVCCDENGNFFAVSLFASGQTARLTIVVNRSKLPEIDLGGEAYVNSVTVRVGAGYLAVFGQQSSGSNLRLFRLNGVTPTEVATNDYFKDFYGKKFAPPQTPVPIAIDGSGTPQGGDVAIFRSGGKTYLDISASGVRDLYELVDSGEPIVIPPVSLPTLPVSPPAPPAPPAPPTAPPVVPPPLAPPPSSELKIVASGNLMVNGRVTLSVGGLSPVSKGLTWRFGDGQQEGGGAMIAPNPTVHVYGRAGIFKVECFVSASLMNAQMMVAVKPIEITIIGPTIIQPSAGKQRAVR